MLVCVFARIIEQPAREEHIRLPLGEGVGEGIALVLRRVFQHNRFSLRDLCAHIRQAQLVAKVDFVIIRLIGKGEGENAPR